MAKVLCLSLKRYASFVGFVQAEATSDHSA